MERRTYILYMATNLVNGKRYIGQTWQTLANRKSKHISDSLSGREKCYFNLAIVKHGKQNFIWKEIDRVFTAKASDALEIHYIKYYKTRDRNIGYNLARGGRVNRGFKKTAEQNKAASERMKRLYAEGKIIAPSKGKIYSEEQKIKMIGYNPLSKEVRCTETGQIYPSIREAARQTGTNRSSLRHVIIGNQLTAGDLHWESYPRTQVDKDRDNKKMRKRKRQVLCNETGIVYKTIKAASSATGADETMIGQILDKKRNSTKGLTFTEIS